jgi:hypothetical protein
MKDNHVAFKIASVAAIALTLGACQSLFQPNYRAPLETTRDASEQLKPGCRIRIARW